MLSIKKASLRKFGLAAVIAGLIVASVAGVASASGSAVTITSPSSGSVDLYYDANNNHVNEQAEFVGNFPIYTAAGVVFRWPAYSFPGVVNGSYRIALWQNTTPLGPATWVERKVAHDFADNPAGTSNYLFGPFFNYEGICGFCPSKIVVVPEAYTAQNGLIVYGPLQAALDSSGKPAGYMESDEFVLDSQASHGHDSDRKTTGASNPPPPTCSSPQESKRCCQEAGGTWVTGDGDSFCSTGD